MSALLDLDLDSCALSLRGHGASGGRSHLQRFRIRDYVADLRRVLETMEPKPVLVGHSMGGLIAQLTAAEVQVPGLALLASSPAGGMSRDGLRMVIRQPRAFLRAMRRRSFQSLYEDPAVARWLLMRRGAPLEEVEALVATLQEEAWQAGLDMLRILPDPKRSRCPVLVVGGDEDNMVAPRSVHRTARAYRTEAVFLPGRGHMIQLEGEISELAGLLSNFRSRILAGSSPGLY